MSLFRLCKLCTQTMNLTCLSVPMHENGFVSVEMQNNFCVCLCRIRSVSREFLAKENKNDLHIILHSSMFKIAIFWLFTEEYPDSKKSLLKNIFQMVSSMILGSKNILSQDDVLLKMFDFSSLSIWQTFESLHRCVFASTVI